MLYALKKYYEIIKYWKGELYFIITLKWDYKKRYVGTSMLKYIPKQQSKYNHIPPPKMANTPLLLLPQNYGSEALDPIPADINPFLTKMSKTMSSK